MTELRHERGPGRGPGEGRWSCGSWAGRRYRRMAMPDILDLEGQMGRSDRPRRLLMGQWRGKYLDTGPPRGPGHYSQDDCWWWDDHQQRWFRVTDQEDVLEIEAEDVGGISPAASLLTTLSSQYGNGYFRFVARARSADPRWPTYAMAGATFPGTRPSPADVGAQGAWLDDQRQRFDELHRQLLAEGWRPAGHGVHWWSVIYRRPDLDWQTPAHAYQQTQRSA